jgi:hypothetical protein
MLNKGKLTLSTPEYEFEIRNGMLVRALGPSVYAGSKIDLSAQPRPVFRSWHEYVKTAIPIVEKNLKNATAEYRALADRVEALYTSNMVVGGALSEVAIQDIMSVTPFKTAPEEMFYYREAVGFHLELKQSCGCTELETKVDLDANKTKSSLKTNATIDNVTEHMRFVAFVTTRKNDLEVYAQQMIPKLQSSPQAVNDKRFAGDILAFEKDVDAFYNKHCKPAIDMLKGANQLQKVV